MKTPIKQLHVGDKFKMNKNNTEIFTIVDCDPDTVGIESTTGNHGYIYNNIMVYALPKYSNYLRHHSNFKWAVE